MEFVLGLAEASWVEIGIVAIPLLITAMVIFLRYKAKSDKAEIMGEVESKIAEELGPIEKRMDKHDTDFKDFKRDEIAPMKETLNELVTTTSVIESQMKTMIKIQSKIESLIGKLFDKLDSKADKK